jgi:5,10-methylenetetrahydrofolate reductase
MSPEEIYHYIGRISHSIQINRGHAMKNIPMLNQLDRRLEELLATEDTYEHVLQQANYIAARQLVNSYQYHMYINKWSAKINKAFQQ